MNTFSRRLLLGSLRAADIGLMTTAFAVALVRSGQPINSSGLDAFLSARIEVWNLLLFVGFAIAWHLIFTSAGLYRSHRIGRLASEWWEITKAVILGTAVLAVGAFMLELSAVNRVFLGTFFLVAMVGTHGMRGILRFLLSEARRRGRNLRNVVIVGCGRRGAALGREIWKRPELGYLLVGYIDDIPTPLSPLHAEQERLMGSLSEIDRLICGQQIDEVFVTLPVKSYYETIAHIVGLGERWGFTVRIPADVFEVQLSKSNVDYLDGTPILTLETPRPASVQLAIKRGIDIVAAGLALVALTPVAVIVAIAIKLDSRGPVLFRQERVGLSGRKFPVFKFRTMVTNAEDRLEELESHNEVQGAAFKMKHDPRVTRVGRVLRKFSIDELPQFINVLRGDMSLVGPRPLPIRDVERFDARWFSRRFSVKPGLTCLWQVNGRHEISFEHWMELDLQYIDHWSLKLDCEILAKTIPTVLGGVGAS